MKDIAFTALAFATPVICAIFAGMLAWQGKPGWGWFLFVAVLIMCSIKIHVE